MGKYRRLLLVVLGLGGCARITETTTFTHTPVGRRSSMAVVPDSIEYSASSQLQGRILLVAIHRDETCRTTVVPVLRKEAHIKRAVADGNAGMVSSPTASLVVGMTLLGLGLFSYVDAENLSATSSNPEESTPENYRKTGVALGGVSAAFFGIALIDSIRLRDSDEAMGEVDGEPEVTSALCRRAPASEVAVQVMAQRTTWRETARTDSAGKASIDLLSIEESALAGGSLSLQLSIEGKLLSIELTSAQVEGLLSQLSGDATSRVSQDRARRQVAECESKVAAARANAVEETSSDDEVADAERAWQRAEEVCGARWREEYGKERDKLRAQIASTDNARASFRCQGAAVRASEAVAQRLDDDEPLQVDALYEDVAAGCKGAPNGAAVIAAWARKKVLVAAAEELDANLANHDALALRAQLRDGELAAAVRREGWLLQELPVLAAHWIGALESGGVNDLARAQFCASRVLYLSFVGKVPWSKLRAEVARRNDVMKAAQLVRLMDGGGCR